MTRRRELVWHTCLVSPRATDVLSRMVLLAGAVATIATDCQPPECEADEECPAMCRLAIERAERSNEDAANAPPRELSAWACTVRVTLFADGDSGERARCDCVDPEQVHVILWGGDDSCLVTARNARCLLSAAELPSDLCVPGDPASCALVCDDLEARLAEDATRPVERTLIDSRCDFSCRCTVEIEGACFEGSHWSVAGLGPGSEVPCP